MASGFHGLESLRFAAMEWQALRFASAWNFAPYQNVGVANAFNVTPFSFAPLNFAPMSFNAFAPGMSGVTAQVALPNGATTTTTPNGPGFAVTVAQAIPYSAVVGVPPNSINQPTGTVTFFVDGTAVGAPAPIVSNGTAFISLPSLTAGSHTVLAKYSGDANFSPSMGSTTQAVGQALTSTTVASVNFTQPANQPVFLNTTVAPANATVGGYPAITGPVSFFDNGAFIAQSGVTGGFAQLVRTFRIGPHSITAGYLGDANFLASNSAISPVNFTVVPGGGGGVTLPGVGAQAPTVLGVQRFGYHWQPTVLTIAFSSPMNAARAQDPNNYQIVAPDGSTIPVAGAVYDPASQSVTLYPSQRLNLHHTYTLTAFGGPGGLTDVSGVPLNGSGQVGSNYTTQLTARNLVIPGFSALQTDAFLSFYGLL